MNIIQKGISKGLISFDEHNKQITYIHQNKTKNYGNPEEKVQAETFVNLVLSYKYPAKQIELYKTVTMGASKKEVDMVVYKDAKCSKPHIIVECKKQDVSEQEFKQAIEQAASYAWAIAGTSKYLLVTTGIRKEAFTINKDNNIKNPIADIPKYGDDKILPYKYVKGGRKKDDEIIDDPKSKEDEIKNTYFDIETVTEDDLTRRFKQAHNALWAGGELNPSSAFDELDKLIFCKIWDELKSRKIGEPYLFQIYNAAIPENASEDEREKIKLNDSLELESRVKKLYAEGKIRDPEVFKDDIRLNHHKIKTVVNYLEGINISETDLDSKGKAFETFMGAYFRGDFGQFFTPRSIVKFIVNTLPMNHDDRVLDTSCGSGGFLLYALDKIRTQAKEYHHPEKEAVKFHNHWHSFAENNLFGIEINEQIARTAKMNMIIHDDGHTNVIAADGLMRSEEIIKKTKNEEFKYNSFDYIITNPPFGSSVKQTEKAYLRLYNLGNKDVSWLDTSKSAVKNRTNQSTEVLFIEQCHNFLKPNGFLSIVVPDGILTNSSLQYLRNRIEEWYRIVAIVSLPQTAFSHTGAGVKSSIMFLQKWDNVTTQNITNKKQEIKDDLKEDTNYYQTIKDWDKSKKDIINKLIGFKTETEKTNLSKIKKTAEYKEWKSKITAEYRQKTEALKEQLEDKYQTKKQKKLQNYPIFMAIAQDVGYDATGKPTHNNELDKISEELQLFIAHIQENPYHPFTLSPDTDKNKIFIVLRGEIQGRFDPHPYHKDRINALKKLKCIETKKLKNVIISKKSITNKINENDIFVGLENIESNTGQYIPKLDKISISSAVIFKKGQILFSKLRPYLNKVYLAEFNGLCSTEFHVFETIQMSPMFLSIYLRSDIIVSQTKQLMTGNTLPRLQTNDIWNIPVPIISIKKQQKIVDIYERALKEKQEKEAKAQELLNSIDSYLLGELGITLPEKNNSLENRIFITDYKNVSGGRLDPKLYDNNTHLLRTAIANSKFTTSKLKRFIVQSFAGDWGKDENEKLNDDYTKCLVIRATEFDNQYNLKLDNSRVKYRLIHNDKLAKIDIQENDLLIEKSGGSKDQPVGRISILRKNILENNTICYSNFIHKIRVSEEINPEYLFCFLKTVHNIKLTDAMQSQTNGIRNLIMNNYFNQEIPVPPLGKQEEIATHISGLRDLAKKLQTEATTVLSTAKQTVEQMILE